MDNKKNLVGVIALVVILLIFSIGGFFLMKYMTNSTHEKRKEPKKEDIRIDTSKDYVYMENNEEIIDDVFKEDIVLNFKGLEEVNRTLHNELEELNKEKVLYKDQELPEGVVCENDLYSFKYREYTPVIFGNYVSLLIVDYDYNCATGTTPISMKSYIVKKDSGRLLTTDEVKNEFNVNDEKLEAAVRKRLDNTQTLDEENIQAINVEETMSNYQKAAFNTTKALSIGKVGDLTVNFIVKSNKINYNDSVEIEEGE